MDRDKFNRLMKGTGSLDYELYLDTPRLLSCQKEPDALVNRDELQRLLEEAFASNGSAHWLDRLRDADVPAALVFDYAEMSKQDQPWANGYLVNQEHPRFGTQRVVGLHIQLSETPGEVSAPAPELGADTDAVLRWAGLIED